MGFTHNLSRAFLLSYRLAGAARNVSLLKIRAPSASRSLIHTSGNIYESRSLWGGASWCSSVIVPVSLQVGFENHFVTTGMRLSPTKKAHWKVVFCQVWPNIWRWRLAMRMCARTSICASACICEQLCYNSRKVVYKIQLLKVTSQTVVNHQRDLAQRLDTLSIVWARRNRMRRFRSPHTFVQIVLLRCLESGLQIILR